MTPLTKVRRCTEPFQDLVCACVFVCLCVHIWTLVHLMLISSVFFPAPPPFAVCFTQNILYQSRLYSQHSNEGSVPVAESGFFFAGYYISLLLWQMECLLFFPPTFKYPRTRLHLFCLHLQLPYSQGYQSDLL